MATFFKERTPTVDAGPSSFSLQPGQAPAGCGTSSGRRPPSPPLLRGGLRPPVKRQEATFHLPLLGNGKMEGGTSAVVVRRSKKKKKKRGGERRRRDSFLPLHFLILSGRRPLPPRRTVGPEEEEPPASFRRPRGNPEDKEKTSGYSAPFPEAVQKRRRRYSRMRKNDVPCGDLSQGCKLRFLLPTSI